MCCRSNVIIWNEPDQIHWETVFMQFPAAFVKFIQFLVLFQLIFVKFRVQICVKMPLPWPRFLVCSICHLEFDNNDFVDWTNRLLLQFLLYFNHPSLRCCNLSDNHAFDWSFFFVTSVFLFTYLSHYKEAGSFVIKLLLCVWPQQS